MSRFLLVVLLLLLAGCSGLAGRTAERTPTPQSLGIKLPAPSTLRGASFTPGERSVTADQYETAFPNSRVQVSGTSLQFAADSAMASPADLAFAMYELDGTGYSGQGLLGIDWQGSAPGNGVYVAIANWVTNSWEWMVTPQTEEIDLGTYTQYVDVTSRHILITVLSTRIQTMTLDEVHFGTPGLEPPINLLATDGSFTDHVALTWDPPATGPFPAGYSIWRSDTQGGVYSQIDTTVGLTNYDDMTSVVDTTYWYKVKSTKSGEPDSALSAADDGFCTAGGFGWTITPASTFAVDPIYLSLALVNTKPAIVYNKNAGVYPIYYAQAQNAAGTAWNGTINNDAGLKEPCLGFFGGWPGYSFDGPSGSGDLWYRNGADADGGSWNSPIKAFDSASAHVCSDPNLLAVNGNPSIAFMYSDFMNGTGTELDFIRANDNAGNSWPVNRVVVDSGEKAWNPKLVILGSGFPAILYSETDNVGSNPARVLYTRATNANGTAWTVPVTLYTFANSGTLPQLQIIIANGIPAVFIHDLGEGGDLYYKRANDADGTAWPPGATKRADDVDFFDGACTVNGKPAVAYVADSGTNLKYLEAIDTSGNSWLPAALVENVPGGLGLATMHAFGSPTEHACIAYRVDGVEIRYARKN